MSTEPIYPQDFEESDALEQERLAILRYREYLQRRGIGEAEHEAQVMDWCDRQD